MSTTISYNPLLCYANGGIISIATVLYFFVKKFEKKFDHLGWIPNLFKGNKKLALIFVTHPSKILDEKGKWARKLREKGYKVILFNKYEDDRYFKKIYKHVRKCSKLTVLGYAKPEYAIWAGFVNGKNSIDKYYSIKNNELIPFKHASAKLILPKTKINTKKLVIIKQNGDIQIKMRNVIDLSSKKPYILSYNYVLKFKKLIKDTFDGEKNVNISFVGSTPIALALGTAFSMKSQNLTVSIYNNHTKAYTDKVNLSELLANLNK